MTEGTFFKIVNEVSDNDFEIIAEDITLHSEKNQPLNIQIAKNNGETLVKNTGGNATVVSQKDPLHKEEKLLAKEVISIKDNDITNITPEGFTTFLAKNNITETLFLPDLFDTEETVSLPVDALAFQTTEIVSTDPALSSDLTALEGDEEAPLPLPTALTLPDIGEALFLGEKSEKEETISENVKVDLGLAHKELTIPSTAQTDVLKNSLNGFFLINIFERITRATRAGDGEKRTESLKDLASKVNAIAKAFGQDVSTSHAPTEIKNQILSLKATLSAEFYITPSQADQFSKIANRCDYLATLTNE